MSENGYFSTYGEARAWFLEQIEACKKVGHVSKVESVAIPGFEGLYTDVCWIEPPKKEKLVVITTGLHGIEGFIGSAMARLFVEQFVPKLDLETTGVLIVHAINAWGMEHGRKVNENGVDLNRNFLLEVEETGGVNPGFDDHRDLLVPTRSLGWLEGELMGVIGKILAALVSKGIGGVTSAALLGQHKERKAMFYGGEGLEPEAEMVVRITRQALSEYKHVIVMDQHSGYGPRYQMSLTVLPDLPESSEELCQKFNYPLVFKVNPEEFYQIHGDMTVALSRIGSSDEMGEVDFVCAFEFGTYGDGIFAKARSLIAMIFESQNYWFPSNSRRTDRLVRAWFRELYYPKEQKWRDKAMVDGRQAFEGILMAFGYL